MGLGIDVNTLLGFTRALDRNGNHQVDDSEARVLGRVGNRNGANGTRETAESAARGEAALSDFRLGERDADELARGLAQGDTWVSKNDLSISSAALDRIDGMAGGAVDGRVSRSELSAALQRGGFALAKDGLMLSREAEARFGGRPTPPPVGRPVPPPVEPAPRRSFALETLELARGAAQAGYTSRANEAYSAAISQAVEPGEALTIARDAASRGYTNRANDAFGRASSLSASAGEALGVAREARTRGYTNQANVAYSQAISQSRSPFESLDVARDAAANGFTNRANDAYSKASSESRSSGQALDVARDAASKGYTNRANEAFSRAIDLGVSRAEALDVAREATSRGYTNRANDAFRKATYLP